jgi:hypothetical protein
LAAARLLSGRVTRSDPPSALSNNYARVDLELSGETVAVLLNSVHPLVGFTEVLSERETRYRFKDVAALAALFRGTGVYQVLTAAVLDRPVSDGSCERLAEIEQKQVRYWRPSRVGDVIFNSWD